MHKVEEDMKCPCCGSETPFVNTLFCNNCGYKLEPLINKRECSLNEKIAQRLKIAGKEELSEALFGEDKGSYIRNSVCVC